MRNPDRYIDTVKGAAHAPVLYRLRARVHEEAVEGTTVRRLTLVLQDLVGHHLLRSRE